MNRRLLRIIIVLLLVVGAYWLGTRVFGVNFIGAISPSGEAAITVPAGFRVNVFASGLHAPRLMTVGADGAVFVAEQGAGRITALYDHDGDGAADARIAVADGLHSPQSLSFSGADLLVGETDRVSKLHFSSGLSAVQTTLIPDLPNDGVHTTKTVLAAPDGRIYVAMGSTCNLCREADPRRAAVSVYDANGGNGTVFAGGLRNAVGLAINPHSGAIWATNNGRDLWGDDRPPETVYALQQGGDYGWPRCHAGDLPDPDFGGPDVCTGVIAPLVRMQAHMAPLGLAFYTATQFPAPYRDSLYIALHGSWNRSEPVGYKVMRVPLRDGKVAGDAEDFATGWLAAGGLQVLGRPVGLAVAADGSLLVSDDKGGIIYRIAYAP